MYLTAIKSFLRFFDGRQVAVVVHDDGSLTKRDKELLAQHVTGMRLIEKRQADEQIASYLHGFPLCREYRDKFVNIIQLFDFFLLSGSRKIILMDSDTLFFQKPFKIIDWIESTLRENLVAFEDHPKGQKEFLGALGCDFPPHICISLGCLHKDLFDLNLIEDVLNKALSLGDWDLWTQQNIFPLMVHKKLGEYQALFLDKNKYQAFYYPTEKGVVFRHYVSSTYFSRFDRHLADAQMILAQL